MIMVTLLTLLLFAGMAMSKPLHPPVLVSSIIFNDDQSGNKVAVANDDPSLMYEFENPILCSSVDDPIYENGGISGCNSPSVFMGKGGIVKSWKKSWQGGNLSGYEIRVKPSEYEVQHYLVETPKDVYYCVYKDTSASTCKLFPDDPNIKVSDRFAACVTNPSSWARDKNGVMYDCSKPVVNPMDTRTMAYVGRIAQFIVVEITGDNGMVLRCITRYNAIGAIATIPLNENGRLDMMGTVDQNVLILVKFKETPKAKAKKPKNSKTKKK